MKVFTIIWRDSVIEKLEYKHNVKQSEVREVFVNCPKVKFVEKGLRKFENVYVAFGQTNSGRYLVIFFICKNNRAALILSGRNMTAKEKKTYEKK